MDRQRHVRFPPIATELRTSLEVWFVPIGDISFVDNLASRRTPISRIRMSSPSEALVVAVIAFPFSRLHAFCKGRCAGPRPGPTPNLLAVFSHAARTFVHVGELANFSCGVSVDCGLGGSDADLVSAERLRRALTSFRFGVAAGGLSTSPAMDLSCLPIVPPVLPAWASAEDAFANAKCDRASKAIPIDARRIILPPEFVAVSYLSNRGTGRPR